MKLIVTQASLAGCAITLGEDERRIEEEPEYWAHDEKQLERLRRLIGLGTRYTARKSTTTCDLCESASRSLMRAMGLQAKDIGALVSVTQTPDYRMPGNAHVLHDRLGFSMDSPALDLELGCSGFVFGLWNAASLASSGGRPVLLVTGDTLSRQANKSDPGTRPLFGDAGAAALIMPGDDKDIMRFILHSDGSRLRSMYIPAGGARLPSGPETRLEREAEDGGIRSDDDLYMDGFAVFAFTMTEQPRLLRDILAYSGKSLEEVDYFVLHQANRYIVETITRKAGIPPSKAPSGIFSRYGNQNSASIPGVFCGALADSLKKGSFETVLQGYGTGLSWGACQLRLDDMICLLPVPYAGTGKRAG